MTRTDAIRRALLTLCESERAEWDAATNLAAVSVFLKFSQGQLFPEIDVVIKKQKVGHAKTEGMR